MFGCRIIKSQSQSNSHTHSVSVLHFLRWPFFYFHDCCSFHRNSSLYILFTLRRLTRSLLLPLFLFSVFRSSLESLPHFIYSSKEASKKRKENENIVCYWSFSVTWCYRCGKSMGYLQKSYTQYFFFIPAFGAKRFFQIERNIDVWGQEQNIKLIPRRCCCWSISYENVVCIFCVLGSAPPIHLSSKDGERKTDVNIQKHTHSIEISISNSLLTFFEIIFKN